MAKLALIQRELKRKNLVLKYKKKYDELKVIINSTASTEEQQFSARLALQKLPKNANPNRQRRRCAITGRPRGTYRYFGLGRTKLRELAFAGEVPGIIKASW